MKIEIDTDDLKRLVAQKVYDKGRWECPDCGSNYTHYICGTTYCSGCHGPVSAILLGNTDKARERRGSK